MAVVGWVLDDRFERPTYFPDFRQEMESMRLAGAMDRQLRVAQGQNPTGVFCSSQIDERFCRRLEVHTIGRGTSSANVYRYIWKGKLACDDVRRALMLLSDAEPSSLRVESLGVFDEYLAKLDEVSRRQTEHHLYIAAADRSYQTGSPEYAALKELLGRVSSVRLDCDRQPVRIFVEVRKPTDASRARVN